MTVRIGVDCDGVLGRFNGLALDIIKDLWDGNGLVRSKPFLDSDVTTADYRNLLPTQGMRDEFRARLDVSFALDIHPYPHAKELLARLAGLGEVWVVTSPMVHNPTWVYDRLFWLKHVLGVDRHRVAFMSDKSAFDGAVLIDDLAKNLHEFEDGGPDRRGILWRQPYSEDGHAWHGWSVTTVDEAVSATELELYGERTPFG